MRSQQSRVSLPTPATQEPEDRKPEKASPREPDPQAYRQIVMPDVSLTWLKQHTMLIRLDLLRSLRRVRQAIADGIDDPSLPTQRDTIERELLSLSDVELFLDNARLLPPKRTYARSERPLPADGAP